MDNNVPVSASAVNPQATQDFTTNSNNPVKHHRPFKKLLLILAILLLLPITIFILNQSKNIHKQHPTAEKFKLTESSPADQDSSFSTTGQPTFVFSKNIGISESDLGKYFHMSPSVPGFWHLEKNGQVVYFSTDRSQSDGFPNTLSYNTVYTVTIDKNLHSSDNQGLPADISVTFRTKQNPSFSIQSDKKLIATTPNQSVTVNFNSYGVTTSNPGAFAGSSLTATIQSATENQLLQYFSYKEGKYPLYQFVSSFTTDDKQIQLVLQNGESLNTYKVQLPNDTFPKPGLYFVTLSNDKGSEDLFVVVSNHINQVFNDVNNTYVWTSEQSTGKSISGVTAELYKAKNAPVLMDKVVSGNDGIAKSQQSAALVDFVITHNNNDIAVTLTKSYGYYGYASSGGDKYQVFSYSDRPVYRPGDLVHYKAVLRKKDNGNYVIPTGTYYMQTLFDYGSSDSNNTYKALDVDQNGTVTSDVQLPSMTTGTYPQITLSVKNSDGTYRQIDSLPLVIQSYRKPDMDITATSPEKEYISSDSAHFTVYAKTNYGQPLSNVDFSYRVLISDFEEVKDRTTEDIGGTVSGYYGAGNELVSGTGKFDGKGVAQITFSTTLPSKYELSQIATLEVTPNIGASPSIGKIAKLIHRGEFALFIDNLTGDTDNGISGTISVLNHNTPRQAVNGMPVTLSLYRVVDYNTKQLVQTQSTTSGTDGTANFSFQKVDAGTYEVVAQANDARSNTVTARKQIYVGQKQQYVSNQPQDTLDLKTQKSSYAVGDNANVIVSANFSINEAIVIITNDGGNSSNIVSLTNNNVGKSSWTLPIQIKDSYGQEVGVDIYTVNNGKVVGGHTNITIDKGNQEINTKISFDKQVYKPGDTVSATITTKDQKGNPVSADNSLSVIDASILQIGQLNGNIFDSFYGYTPYSAVAHYDSTTGIQRDVAGGGGGCFLEGTKILMSDGTSKNIENVQVGNKILTRASDNSPQLVVDTVVNTYRHAVTDYLTINNSLNVTWIHRIYINNAWHEAKDARVGDMLLDEYGNFVKITSITPHLGQFVVYNLTTSHYHTFFANGFYVHNDKGIGPRENFVDTVYWNPHIQTNAEGTATISFKLPDNLTTFTAQAFSNTQNSQFGQATADLVSHKDFNIIPAISSFYYQGDKPVISALIQNSSQQDIDANVVLTVKELGITKNKTLHINKGDFGTATFPIEIGAQTGDISFVIEAKDANGNLLDSMLVKKPILPKGNIVSSWLSLQGSQNISSAPSYPGLDFNKVTLSVVPNIVSNLFHSSIYLDNQPSIATGQDLYVYSYILAKTRDGEISPTSYDYAKLKNDFRDEVSALIEERAGDHWNLPSYSDNESLAAMNLWLAQGFDQAMKVNMLGEINNISSIVSSTKQYITSSGQKQSNPINPSPIQLLPSQLSQAILLSTPYSRDEQLARQWVLGENITDASYQKTPESLAIRTLNGDRLALEQLRLSSLTTANDRYIWDGDAQYAQVFPVLAMIEKGSQSDADKAIKGLSFAMSDSNLSPLAILAGVKYAERNNFYIDEPSIKVSVNNQVMYVNKQNQPYIAFTQSFLAKNNKDGKVNLNIETGGDIPVYSTIIQTDYTNQANTSANINISLLDNIKQLFGMGTALTKGEAKVIDVNLKRVYKDTNTGQDIQEIKQGEAGIVALTGDNKFTKYLVNNQFQNNSVYSFDLEDAISPSFIYLIQTNEYSNSPQYKSVLSKIFPGNNEYYGDVTSPNDYSDQAVFFNSSLSQSNIILPYVVYNVSGGTYYQPKTSIVFPILGLIANEK